MRAPARPPTKEDDGEEEEEIDTEDDDIDSDEEQSSSVPTDSGDEYTGDGEEEQAEVEFEQQMPGERAVVPDGDRKSENVDALVRGNLVVRRQSLLPRVLSVTDGAAVCRKPFKPPCSSGYNDSSEKLFRRLGARRRFVPWGSSTPVVIPSSTRTSVPNLAEEEAEEETVALPPGIEPLVLWQPSELEDGAISLPPIMVDPVLVQFLRPHQREGVQFMFECVSGLNSAANINGCILADDMGLGKTLQSITLLYTLLCQGFDGKPMVKKAIICTPTSLVSNWEAEIKKWIGERVKLIALCESTREDVVSGINSFASPFNSTQVLIVSYETFRLHSTKFNREGSCDLLICDEAHRLKNDQTLTNRALAALSCKRRILLSGTPMQNDLEEFYAMVNFTNPGILGDAAYFRRYYEAPIISGREPTATDDEMNLGNERSAELSAKVNQFILRRTNALLSNHLPPKIIEVVCCKLTTLQAEIYNHFIHSKNVKRAINEEAKQSKILAYITALKKLCNHPKLIYDTIKSGSPGTSGFEDCIRFFPPSMFSGRSGSWSGGDGSWVELSGKMHVLARLLAHLRRRTDDRIVLVSNYTQDEFVFLLSSKAGGCGLNLIGGNRLVLFDPDWNPANDKQVYQRQMSKEGLQKVIQNERNDSNEKQVNLLSADDLRDLFTFHENVRSEIHENMNCARCLVHNDDEPKSIENEDTSGDDNKSSEDASDIGGFAGISGCVDKLKSSEKQVGTPLEEDLSSWGHHLQPNSVPDSILQDSAGDEVTFVFTNQVDGKLIPIESNPPAKIQFDDKENRIPKSILFAKPRKSISSCVDPSTSSASLQQTPMQRTTLKRSRTPLKGIANAELKSKLAFSGKRPSPFVTVGDDDDDFA
ncbi:Protein CHROMATIN REMODELING 25 [Linum perenne]